MRSYVDCWCWRRWQNVLHCMEMNGNHYSIMCRGGGYRKPPSRGIAFAQTPTDAKISLSGLTRKEKKIQLIFRNVVIVVFSWAWFAAHHRNEHSITSVSLSFGDLADLLMIFTFHLDLQLREWNKPKMKTKMMKKKKKWNTILIYCRALTFSDHHLRSHDFFDTIALDWNCS